MQVPALHVAGAQRVAHVGGVAPPHAVHLRGRVVGGHGVARPVGQPHLGAGERRLQQLADQVERRGGQALLGGGQPDRRGVVVDADVRPPQPPGGGRAKVAQDDAAVGAEQRLGGLDLRFEAQPPRRQPVRVLQGGQDLGERGDVGGRHDLGEGDDQARRQALGALEVRAEEAVEGGDAARGGPVAEGLDAQPHERRQRPGGGGRGQRRGGRRGVAVLDVVAAVAVAVLEVDAQVLQRLAGELGGHLRPHRGGELRPDGEDLGDGGGVGGVLVEQARGLGAHVADGGGGDAVRGQVQHLHGLAAGRSAGPVAAHRRVRVGDAGQQPRDDRRRQPGGHGVAGPAAPSRTRVPSMTPKGRSVATNTTSGLSLP